MLSHTAVIAALVFVAGARAEGSKVTYLARARRLGRQGDPEDLLTLVRGEYEQLRLVNLARGGESIRTLIEGIPWCQGAAGALVADLYRAGG